MVQPLESLLIARLELIKQNLFSDLEARWGLVVSYEKLDPSLLLGIKIVGLNLRWRDGEDFFSSRDVFLDLDFFQLLLGDPLKAFKAMDLRDAELSMDFENQKEKLLLLGLSLDGDKAAVSNNPDWTAESVLDLLAQTLPTDVDFRLRNFRIKLRSEQGSIRLQIDTAALKNLEDVLNLDFSSDYEVRLADGVFLGQKIAADQALISANLWLKAQFFKDVKRITLELASKRFQTPWFDLRQQSFAMTFTEKGFRIQKKVDEQAFDAFLSFDALKGLVNVSVQAKEWQPSSLLDLKQKTDKNLLELLSSRLDADLNLTWSPSNNALRYDFNAKAAGSLLQLGPSTVELVASGTHESSTISKLELKNSQLALSYKGLYAFKDHSLNGLLKADYLGLSDFPVRFETQLRGNQYLGYQLLQNSLDLAQQKIVFDETVLISRANQVFLSGRLHPQGDASQQSVVFDLKYNLTNGKFAESSFDVQDWLIDKDDPSIRKALRLVGLADSVIDGEFVPKTVRVSLQARLDQNRPEPIEIDKLELVANGPNISLVISGSWKDQKIALDTLIAELNGIKLKATGNLDFRKNGQLSFGGEFSLNEATNVPITINYSPEGTLELSSEKKLYAFVEFKSGSASGFFQTETFPLQYGGIATGISSNGSFSLASDGNWKVVVRSLDAGTIAFNPLRPDARLRIKANDITLDSRGGKVGTLILQDSFSILSGPVNLTWQGGADNGMQLDGNLESMGSGFLINSRPNKETISIKGSFSSDSTHLAVSVKAMPIQRFLILGIDGLVDLDVNLVQSDGLLLVDGLATLNNAAFNRSEVQGQIPFTFSNQVLTIKDMWVSMDAVRFDMQQFSYDIGGSRLSFAGLLGSESVRSQDRINWQGDLQWKSDAFPQELKGSLLANNLPDYLSPNKQWNFELSTGADGQSISLIDLESGLIRAGIQNNAGFFLDLQKPLPFSARIEGSLKDGYVEANIQNLVVDMSLSKLLPFSEAFWLSKGTLSGSLRMVGNINNPGFYGNVKIENATAQVAQVPEPLFFERAYAVFEDRSIRVLPFSVSQDKSIARVEVKLQLDNWQAPLTVVEVSTESQPGVRVKAEFPNISIDGYAQGNLKLIFFPYKMEITGSLVAEETTISLAPNQIANQSQLESSSDSTEYFTFVDLSLVTSKGVEFIWPNRSLPVLTTFLDIGQKMRLIYDDASGLFSFKGQVKGKGGEITYLKRSFYLKETLIDFNENQLSFDPIVSLRAELRSIYNRKPAKLLLIVDQNRLSQLQPRLESEPALGYNQIISLLTGGTQVDETISIDTLTGALLETASQYVLIKEVESRLSKLLGLDLFSMRTGIVKNVIYDIADQLSPLDNGIVSLGKYLDETSFLVGKYLGEDLYLEMGAGFQSDQTSFKPWNKVLDMTINLEASLEFKTPYFDLLWSVKPQDLQTLFLKDQSFTFTFRF